MKNTCTVLLVESTPLFSDYNSTMLILECIKDKMTVFHNLKCCFASPCYIAYRIKIWYFRYVNTFLLAQKIIEYDLNLLLNVTCCLKLMRLCKVHMNFKSHAIQTNCTTINLLYVKEFFYVNLISD